MPSIRNPKRNMVTLPHAWRCGGSGAYTTTILFLLLVLLQVVIVQGKVNTQPFAVHDSRRYPYRNAWTQRLAREPLVDWLDQLQVHIPDQSFTAKLITIQVRNLTCTHFGLTDVESHHLPRHGTDSPVMELVVHNISASCLGLYQVTGGVSGQITAHMGAASNPTSVAALEWQLAIQDNDTISLLMRQPGNVSTVSCASQLVVTDLHFFGSASATIIDLFAASIRHAVNDAVQGQICTNLKSTVDPLLTRELQTALQWLQPYLNHGSIDPAVSKREATTTTTTRTLAHYHAMDPRDTLSTSKAESPLLRWDTDVPVFVQTLQAVNAFVADHLDRGFWAVWDTCGGFCQGWNGVWRQWLSTSNGTWNVPRSSHHVHAVIPRYAAVDLTLHNVTVSGAGLAQWTHLTLMNPVDESTLTSRLATTGPLRMTTSITLQLTTVPGGMFQGDTLMESFVVHLDVASLAAALNVSLALDKSTFERLTVETLVAALWHHTASPDCVTESIQSASIHGLSLQTNVTGIVVDPVAAEDDVALPKGGQLATNQALEHDIDVLINNALQLVLTEYQPLVTEAIHGLTQGPVQDQINQWLQDAINTTTDDLNCTASNPGDDTPELPHWMNFSLVQPLHQINAFLNEPSTISTLNGYLDCIASKISTFVSDLVVGVRYSKDVRADTIASLLRLKSFNLTNIGGVQGLRVWQPDLEGYHLESSFQFGSGQAGSASRPGMFVSVGMDHLAFQNLSAEANVTVYFDDVGWDAISMVRFDGRQLMKAKVFNLLSNGHCALVPMNDFDISAFAAHLGFFQTLANVSVTMDDGSMELSFDSLSVDDVQSTINAVIGWMTESLHVFLQAATKTTLSRSRATCTAETPEIVPDDSTPSDSGEIENMNSILLILAAVFVFAQPAILLMQRAKDQGEDERSAVDLTEPLLNPGSVDSAAAPEPRIVESDSLMFQPSVPATTRYLVPISILVVIALLLASNLSVGATVDMVVSVEGNVFRVPPLFGFSLLNTARDMFQAGIYPLFFLVVGFSGVWPYAKLLMMLSMWTSPQRALSRERRGKLLLKLDALSKFSLVDTYVLVVMLVAFRFHLQPLDGTELDVYVTPQFGFYGFLFATSASLVIGHWMVFEHRRSLVQEATPALEIESLFSHTFRFPDGSEGNFSLLFRTLVLSSLVLIVVLLGIGIFQQSFVFEFGGLAGFALQDQYRNSYSLVSFGSALPTSVEATVGVGIQVLRLVFYFYAVVTPFATLLLVTIILTRPMSVQTQIQFLTAIEIANAWSAMEVFGLSIVAAMFEISTFADFIIGHRCDFINKILAAYGNGIVTTCYTVKSSVSWNVVYLLLGSALNSCCVTVILRMIQAYMSERLCRDEGDVAPVHGPTLSQVVYASRFKSWMLRSDDLVNVSDAASNETSGPPIVGDTLPVSPWQEEESFTSEWNEAAERDPTWKEWKEATNVT